MKFALVARGVLRLCSGPAFRLLGVHVSKNARAAISSVCLKTSRPARNDSIQALQARYLRRRNDRRIVCKRVTVFRYGSKCEHLTEGDPGVYHL